MHHQSRITDFILSRLAGTLAMLALPMLAQAQTDLTLPPFTPIVTVSPLVADVGVPRTITVSASWRDGCVPMNPTLTVGPLPGQNHVNIRFSQPLTLIACTQAVTPYSATLTYTPTQAGTQRIAVTLTDGRYLGGGQIITQATGKVRASRDLSGVWYSPATNGSGLALYHSQEGSDIMAGTWYVFDNNGKPYWYLIQNGRWDAPDRYTGDLVEVTSNPGNCFLLNGCARLMSAATRVGTLRIDVKGLDTIDVAVGVGGPPLSDLVITSNFTATRLRY